MRRSACALPAFGATSDITDDLVAKTPERPVTLVDVLQEPCLKEGLPVSRRTAVRSSAARTFLSNGLFSRSST